MSKLTAVAALAAAFAYVACSGAPEPTDETGTNLVTPIPDDLRLPQVQTAPGSVDKPVPDDLRLPAVKTLPGSVDQPVPGDLQLPAVKTLPGSVDQPVPGDLQLPAVKTLPGSVHEPVPGELWLPERESQLGTNATPAKPVPDPSLLIHPATYETVGELRSAFKDSARKRVCATWTKGMQLHAIDEVHCTIERGERGPIPVCGGCAMTLKPTIFGGWMLAADPGSNDCRDFAGSYLLGNREQTEAACGRVRAVQCGDVICPPEKPVCARDALGEPVCMPK